jgi:glycine/D-amino acid oxidase-like deaminating enzyme
MGAQRERVAVVGGGIAGVCSALALINAHDVIVLERLDALLTQTSRSNVGRIHLGFHYALDSTMDTAAVLVPGWFAFWELMERWTYGEIHDVPHSKPYWWLVERGSFVEPGRYQHYCDHLAAIYHEHRGLGGRAERFPPAGEVSRPLSGEEYSELVDSDHIVYALSSMEDAIQLQPFFDVLGRALHRRGDIDIRCNHGVRAIEPDGDGYRLEVVDSAGGRDFELRCDQVVNATNAHRLWFDREQGFLPGRQWMDRLKVLVDVILPPELEDAHSMQVALGPFGHFTHYDDGTACCGYMPTSIRGDSDAVVGPPEWDRVCEQGYSAAEAERLGRETIEGVARYVPRFAGAKALRVRPGIVHATGTTPITDPHSERQRRADSGVFSLRRGYHSFNCGKLCLAPMHAERLAHLVTEHAQLDRGARVFARGYVPVR